MPADLHRDGFLAAHFAGASRRTKNPKDSGVQKVWAVCEVTGGGKKIFGAAVEFSEDVDASSLALDTFKTAVSPSRRSYFVRGASEEDKLEASPRTVAAIYTNSEPELRPDQKSVAGPYVIAEFQRHPNPSLATDDGDEVTVVQEKAVKSTSGTDFPAVKASFSNAGARGTSTVIRGVDDWEQNHWWWDDSRSAYLEYSIFLPKSFLKEGGENKEYPLVLAISHSGTYYGGTCLETLTDQNIATIWSLPEEQERNECVIITPRYERTTMNDYWEHTYDVENTHRLVLSLMKNTWNYGNPNMLDRRDKVLKIDPKRVYATGWSMGAMTSLWLMAKHPETYAAGFINAGQQRPRDLIDLAHQKLLIVTGTKDGKAFPWNDRCCEEWARQGGKVTRPKTWLNRDLIFPVEDQKELTQQVEGYLAEGGNITYLTFEDVDHMESLREFYYIRAARDWLFRQVKA